MSQLFTGKTAIISGAAGGIGFALARELGQQGMNIVLADIDPAQLAQAEKALQQDNVKVLACQLDVTDFSQWQATAAAAEKHFGPVHMLINNAGVGGIPGSIEDTDHDTWRWVVDVNLMGVLYGTQAVTPLLKSHGQGGWIINVASMAGMMGMPYAGAYCASKAAVVSMTESWSAELKPHNISVSALCPAFVKTRIHESHRNRQAQYKSNKQSMPSKASAASGFNKAAALVEGGIAPDLLAKRVVEALVSGQTYIFTHPNYRPVMQARAEAIDAACQDAQSSPIVGHLVGEDIVAF
ncbi:MAG: NAD(P)-dependent dehydrogenase (short-subunit alcohol dehydrogenase family) [Paraglaciecola sp.]|jgi:NAD(P)-dependent dehydrogenase (short-subunit alcohol dehydrogenase family)